MNRAELLGRISVVPPYLALDHIEVNGDAVHAEIPSSVDVGLEVGPLTTADVARHLALLGSLAAAKNHPEPGRHHYLAYRGWVRRLGIADDGESGIRGVARVLRRERLRTTSFASMSTRSGTALFEMEVQYQVLSPAAFEMFYEELAEQQDTLELPAAGTPVQLEYHAEKQNRLDARIHFSADACQGHFPHLPALPVAKLAGLFNDGVLRMLAEQHPRTRFMLTYGRIAADRFFLPGDLVSVSTERSALDDHRHRFECKAACGGKLAAQMTVEAQKCLGA